LHGQHAAEQRHETGGVRFRLLREVGDDAAGSILSGLTTSGLSSFKDRVFEQCRGLVECALLTSTRFPANRHLSTRL
jgi:hypothetical protein